jgi:hypothetical protein
MPLLNLSLETIRYVAKSTFKIRKTQFKFQSINVVESPRLKNIFLLLRKELKESDIPGRTTIRKRVDEVYEDYLKELETDMKVLCQCAFICGKYLSSNRIQLEKFHSPLTLGQIQTILHLWLSQLIGFKPLLPLLPLELNNSLNSDLTSSVFTNFLGDIQEIILHIAFFL